MTLTDGDIERIAQLIFEKLLDKQKKFEEEEEEIEQIYHIHDELGQIAVVSEQEFFEYELDRLIDLERKYVEEEEFEKANIIKNKIRKVKLKIKKQNGI
jgi:protein-arginine kinase activator protein McsA